MAAEIQYNIVKEADPAEILALYRHPGWWQTDDNPQYLETVRKIVSNSFCFVVARQAGKLVGMGRAISDGVSDSYIQDVVVYSDFRGKGIGAEIVRRLIAFLREHNIQWIGLISEPGHEDFYGRLGFLQMPNYVPMLLKTD